MKFEIEEQILNPPILEKFELELYFMHGDYEHYTGSSIMFNKHEEEELEEYINNVEEMISYISSRPHFSDLKKKIKSNQKLCNVWEYDITTDHQFPAQLSSYEVFYYDDRGNKKRVKVIRK